MPVTAQQLAEQHLNTALAAAWQYAKHTNGTMDVEDAKSAAYLGLVQASQAWAGYCAARGFDPDRLDYFRAYAGRRVKGAIIDEARRADPLSRGQRRHLREMDAALPGGTATDEEYAAAAGLTAGQVRGARIADARNWAASLDSHPDVDEHSGLADTGADVESAAVVSDLLAGFLAAFDGLDAETRVVLALRYHDGRDAGEVAAALGASEEHVQKLHDAGVLAVHDALMRQAQAEGTGTRTQAA